MQPSRFVVCVVTAALLDACGTLEENAWTAGISREQALEIKQALRKITSSPITSFSRSVTDPPNTVHVSTADGENYIARKVHGKWDFEPVAIITELHPNDLTRRCSQHLPVARSHFIMISLSSFQISLVARRRS